MAAVAPLAAAAPAWSSVSEGSTVNDDLAGDTEVDDLAGDTEEDAGGGGSGRVADDVGPSAEGASDGATVAGGGRSRSDAALARRKPRKRECRRARRSRAEAASAALFHALSEPLAGAWRDWALDLAPGD